MTTSRLSTRGSWESMIVKIIKCPVFLRSIILTANSSLLNFCLKPQIHWGFLLELLYSGRTGRLLLQNSFTMQKFQLLSKWPSKNSLFASTRGAFEKLKSSCKNPQWIWGFEQKFNKEQLAGSMIELRSTGHLMILAIILSRPLLTYR